MDDECGQQWNDHQKKVVWSLVAEKRCLSGGVHVFPTVFASVFLATQPQSRGRQHGCHWVGFATSRKAQKLPDGRDWSAGFVPYSTVLAARPTWHAACTVDFCAARFKTLPAVLYRARCQSWRMFLAKQGRRPCFMRHQYTSSHGRPDARCTEIDSLEQGTAVRGTYGISYNVLSLLCTCDNCGSGTEAICISCRVGSNTRRMLK